jgi:murein DD-endopeptidase MepM/ murein hydrolase activator NlpD
MERSRHLQGLLILAGLVVLGGLYLYQNNQPAVTVSVPAATPTPFDAPPDRWQTALETQLAGTPLPTPDLAVTAYIPPTLPPTGEPVNAILEPYQIQSTPYPTLTPGPTVVRPTSSGPTPFPSPTGVFVPELVENNGFQPPPEQVPLSSHANDHFWLLRPVDSSANSESLFYYPFGSNGPADDIRVHHGVDMTNPVGEPIHAGGSGLVVFAGDGGEIVDKTRIDIYPTYGNVVVIEHDFGYRGQKLFTLYAHMSRILVAEGQTVAAGEIIGLTGGTGDVSGPHVHMEVRLGENKYFSALNPLLWIAPYSGHGVVAGRVHDENGAFLDDFAVTLSQYGRVIETTTTYVKPKTPGQTRDWEVVPDPAWQENFVLGDVPAGAYEITVFIGSRRISKQITVRAGTTNMVDLGLEQAATPQPVAEDASAKPS